ncbi:hypothetical protein Dimus_010235, partial [Dionaea muscipula]
AHRYLAREAVKKSLVLLKNGAKTDDPILPLPKNRQDPSSRNPCQQPRQPMWWLEISWQGLTGNNHTTGELYP